MALKGLDIFKMLPKEHANCKECGFPTCMAFAMKVAAGGAEITKCPHVSADVLEKLSESTAPPMKSLSVKLGDSEGKLGGETVLFRHEKTFVSKTLYAFSLCASYGDAEVDDTISTSTAVDYHRIGERMYAEFVNVYSDEDDAKFVALAIKAAALNRGVILTTSNVELAAKALSEIKAAQPILNGANASNYEAFSKLAVENNCLLGVGGETLDELYETVEKLEKLGNKNLILNVGTKDIKSAFEFAVQIRRAALLNNDRTFGYPTIVDVAALAWGNETLQAALAALFTVKYGSIVILQKMDYAKALPLYGLRQNLYTDPQKPMRQEVGIYPFNKGDENSPCFITVDFALTYFVVSGELERSGVPCNLLISDAGGYSVLTSWAAGKFSASTIAKYVTEQVEPKIKNRTLVLPGKVAVLKGELQDKLPGWDIIVGPNEAVALVKFAKELVA
ncbi:MAG: acetyl-CoA decarbonylase/synthase complex subunit gamma [Oscillospiraceae bacterium]|jgi:acetyl-CoA decarbonylase/synthase complex subunit gamma|nr:acetyl-CoA decarbonylase/synthase complex subunit gamma [Oscillospiraceae bacterium]